VIAGTPLRGGNLVFAVCHADDEAVWIGGLLHGLSQLGCLDLHVVCFSGGETRAAEFELARERAGYRAGVVLDLPLRPAPEPLPPLAGLLESGLEQLELAPGAIDLLITHSPYGDEHVNPHHRQAYRELRAWSKRRDVPFGFFTSVASPFAFHVPLLHELRREGTLHLLDLARCRPRVGGLLLGPDWRALATARYFLRFGIDQTTKAEMLACYGSVDQEEFRRGYAMYTSGSESLYVGDERGLLPLRRAIAAMGLPSPVDFFADVAPRNRVWSHIASLSSPLRRHRPRRT
jgi:LmbE family N-acetylglucosaminyl deacetylase